jgi:hypothetical protein
LLGFGHYLTDKSKTGRPKEYHDLVNESTVGGPVWFLLNKEEAIDV